MNDDRFGGELHAWIEPEIEARLVALILGEASDFEMEELERMMKERPELRMFQRRLEVVHDLMGEAVRPPDAAKWRMAPERRAEVMKSLGIEAPEEPVVVPIDAGRERRVRRAGVRVAMMAAACLVISLVLAPFLLRGTKSGWKGGDQMMESVSYSMFRPDEAEKTNLSAGYVGRALNGPASGEGKDPAGSAVGDKLAVLKANLSGGLAMVDEAAPADVVATHAVFGRYDYDNGARADARQSKPSSSMAKVIASSTTSPTAIPVPDVAAPERSTSFGSGDDFGDGWGLGGGGGAFGNGRVSGRTKGLGTEAKKDSLLGEIADSVPQDAPAAPVSRPAPVPSERPAAVRLATPTKEVASVSDSLAWSNSDQRPLTSGNREGAAGPNSGPPVMGDLPAVGRMFRENADGEIARGAVVANGGVAKREEQRKEGGKTKEWKRELNERTSRSSDEAPSDKMRSVKKAARPAKRQSMELEKRLADQSGEVGNVDPFASGGDLYFDDGRAPSAEEIRIKTKNVEVTQANADELGFDWVQDASKKANVSGAKPGDAGWAYEDSEKGKKMVGDDLFVGGGMVGSGRGLDRTAADVISPVSGAAIPGIPAGEGSNVNGVVTGGLRSGDAAITRNSIDAILNNPRREAEESASPGIRSITGLASDAQFQRVKGDLERAKQKPVAPAEPKEFETRKMGVALEVEPLTVGGRVAELNLAADPEVREFDGFMDNGTPVTGKPKATISSGQRTEVERFEELAEKAEKVESGGEMNFLMKTRAGTERPGTTAGNSVGASRYYRQQGVVEKLEKQLEEVSREIVLTDGEELGGNEGEELAGRNNEFAWRGKALGAEERGKSREGVTRSRRNQSNDADGDGLVPEEEVVTRGEPGKETMAWFSRIANKDTNGKAGEASDDSKVLSSMDGKGREVARRGPGGGGGPGSIRERESLRRSSSVADADEALMDGRDAYAKGENAETVTRSSSYRAASDETRERLLTEVDDTWELAVPPAPEESNADVRPGNARVSGLAQVTNKLDSIVIPKIDLEGATVEEAMDLLRQRSRELDNHEMDPNQKGVNLVLRKARIEGGSGVDAELDAEAGLGLGSGPAVIDDLKLENVTLRQALKAIGDKAGLRFKTDEYAVTMLPTGGAEGQDTLTRRWAVPPNFVRDLEGLGAGGGGYEMDPFAVDGGSMGRGLKARKPLAEMLRDHGVKLPSGASASFLPGSNTLVVKGAPDDLELVNSLVEEIGEGTPPVDYMGLYEPPGTLEEDEKERAEDLAVIDKLKTTIIPMVDFDGTTVEEAVEFLQQRSVELDVADQGVDFSIRKPRVEHGTSGVDAELDAEAGLGARDPGQARIKELKLRNVPLATVLQYIGDQAGLRYKVQDGKVTLLPIGGAEGQDVLTRRWKLHPDVLAKLQEDMMEHSYDVDDPFAAAADAESRVRDSLAQMTVNQRDLIDIMKDCGISFPPGSAVTYLAGSQSLIVKNTPSNLDLVDVLVAQTAEHLARERQAVKTNEKSAAQEAFSTFSLHVSEVSFKLAQAALAKGEWPDAARVRVEEFLNAFDYGDPAPSQDEKVACALEQATHPFMQQRNLLRISMRTAAVGRAAGTPLRLTVLLDNSGSMERADRAESVKRAFQLLAAQMNPEDEVTLISFARKPRLMRDSVPGNRVAELVAIIRDTPSEGGTNLEEALRLGLEKAQEDFLEGAQNRIIMLTDGAANLGNAEPELLAQLVEKMRQKGIAFDACGVGAEGLNDDVLEALTRKGDGRYYFLDRPEDADAGFAKQIAGALRPAAKNVKVQVEFNPKRVGHYRLYGFEKHELKKEDFRNDSVDAAEMAAEEAGVAMYQVETLPDGEGDVGSVSVRFQDMATGEMVEKRWPIPYEASPAGLENAVPSMKLAASAAFLGEKLKGSPVGELVELEELSGVSRSLQSVYPSNERVGQLIEMIEKVRSATR